MPLITTLATIEETLRLVTRNPSVAQLTQAQAYNYINKFLLKNLPQHIKLFSLRQVFTFFTQPGVDRYSTVTNDPLSPFFNFKNKYISVHPPVFMAGVPASYTQERNVFYGQWPITQAVINTGLEGNGTIGPFSGIINTAIPSSVPPVPVNPQILQGSVMFTCLNQAGTAMNIIDYPNDNVQGYLGVPNQPDVTTNPYGIINYQTGQYTFNFPQATETSSPLAPNPLTVEYTPYVSGKPIAMLYFNNEFILRPVPNTSYRITVEVDVQPTELLNNASSPDIDQWADFIALGAARLLFRDRGDKASYDEIYDAYKEQMNLVERPTLMQAANERTQTVFTIGRNWWAGWNGFNGPY